MPWFRRLFAFRSARPAPPSVARPRRARPQLEALEARDVPTYIVADFPGYGVYRHDDNQYSSDYGWQGLTSTHASRLAVNTSGDVVGEFPGYGVWVYNNNPYSNQRGWQQLTRSEASIVSIAGNGSWSIAAEFQGYGVWTISPGGRWQQLVNVDASYVGINSSGDVMGAFPGHGVWYHPNYGSWQQIAGVDASQLSFSETYAVGVFNGYGTYRWSWNSGRWSQLTTILARTVSVDASGDVVGDYGSYGVWYYHDSPPIGSSSNWQGLGATGATAVGATPTGAAASFGNGVFYYDFTYEKWIQLMSTSTDWIAIEE
jgi:hypothetical protein